MANAFTVLLIVLIVVPALSVADGDATAALTDDELRLLAADNGTSALTHPATTIVNNLTSHSNNSTFNESQTSLPLPEVAAEAVTVVLPLWSQTLAAHNFSGGNLSIIVDGRALQQFTEQQTTATPVTIQSAATESTTGQQLPSPWTPPINDSVFIGSLDRTTVGLATSVENRSYLLGVVDGADAITTPARPTTTSTDAALLTTKEYGRQLASGTRNDGCLRALPTSRMDMQEFNVITLMFAEEASSPLEKLLAQLCPLLRSAVQTGRIRAKRSVNAIPKESTASDLAAVYLIPAKSVHANETAISFLYRKTGSVPSSTALVAHIRREMLSDLTPLGFVRVFDGSLESTTSEVASDGDDLTLFLLIVAVCVSVIALLVGLIALSCWRRYRRNHYGQWIVNKNIMFGKADTWTGAGMDNDAFSDKGSSLGAGSYPGVCVGAHYHRPGSRITGTPSPPSDPSQGYGSIDGAGVGLFDAASTSPPDVHGWSVRGDMMELVENGRLNNERLIS